jgi:NitT/TauT family transport system ATP-binding protein
MTPIDHFEPRANQQGDVVIENVTRTFLGASSGPVHAVGPVNLRIDEGQFVCLVGPSGCGKSTLLRVIAGLIKPTSGRVRIRRHTENKRLVAMVFQDYSIFPWKTVRQNVRLGLDLAGRSRTQADEVVDMWLERLGLDGFADAYPSTLSGGMKQRVSIARALAIDPEILLMDEPFAALDAQLRTILQDELLELWEAQQRTVVFVTHSLDEALLLGDRVIVMSGRPGRILECVEVGFERPRSPRLRSEARFGALEQRLWQLLRAEVEVEHTTSGE